MSSFVLDAAGHFLYYSDHDPILITMSLLSMECGRFLIFFLVCYYFTKKAASLLPEPDKWLCSLKIVFVVNIAWLITGTLGNFLSYQLEWD